jgi:hypothetical protein
MLAYGIQGFNYASFENVIKRELKVIRRKAKRAARDKETPQARNRARTAAAAEHIFGSSVPGFVGLALGAIFYSMIRELVFNAERYEDMAPEERAKRIVSLGLSRTTGLGPIDPFLQFLTGLKYQRSLAETGIGAVPGYFASAGDKIFRYFSDRNSEDTTTAEYHVGEGIFELLVAPIVTTALAYTPTGGPVSEAVLRGAIWSVRAWRDEFATLFGNRADFRDAVDREYSDQKKAAEKKWTEVKNKIRETPAAQRESEFKELKEQYPELLRDAKIDYYKQTTANAKAGRVGVKPRTVITGKPEELKGTKQIAALNKGVKLLIKKRDLTYGELFELPEGLSSTLDNLRSKGRPAGKSVSRRLIGGIREEMEDNRRNLKRAEVIRLRRLEQDTAD